MTKYLLHRLNKAVNHFFLHHQPPLALKLFLPYHLLFAVCKTVWMVMHLVKDDVHLLEYDARSQWNFHRKMTWFWVSNFPFVTIMYFGFPKAWIGLGLLLNTYYSLYANFDTEFGAIPASYAAMKVDELQTAQNA